MLDLNKINDKLYEIKMLEGEILHIKKPSQKFLTQLVAIKDLQNEGEIGIEAIKMLYDVVLTIFNNNIDGKVYDNNYIENFDITTISLILQDYISFTSEKLGES